MSEVVIQHFVLLFVASKGLGVLAGQKRRKIPIDTS